MKMTRWLGAILGLGWAFAAHAAEQPAREYREVSGWSIGYAPDDSAAADAVAKQVEAFGQRLAQVEAIQHELGAEQVEARLDELAKKTAQICGLPAREADFRREYARAVTSAREWRNVVHQVVARKKIEIWRGDEIYRRLGAGETIEGFAWDAATKQASVNFRVNWVVSPDTYKLTTDIAMPAAYPLKLEGTTSAESQLPKLTKDLDNWANIITQVFGNTEPLAVRAALSVAMRKVLKTECPDNPASNWIDDGLIGWTWRELILQVVPRKAASKYTDVVAQLPVPKAGDAPYNLEVWPEHEQGAYPLIARQVFINIAESDGPDAMPHLLAAFWKLPVEKRTTAGLKTVYREQTKNALETRAPLRSLGKPPE